MLHLLSLSLGCFLGPRVMCAHQSKQVQHLRLLTQTITIHCCHPENFKTSTQKQAAQRRGHTAAAHTARAIQAQLLACHTVHQWYHACVKSARSGPMQAYGACIKRHVPYAAPRSNLLEARSLYTSAHMLVSGCQRNDCLPAAAGHYCILSPALNSDTGCLDTGLRPGYGQSQGMHL